MAEAPRDTSTRYLIGKRASREQPMKRALLRQPQSTGATEFTQLSGRPTAYLLEVQDLAFHVGSSMFLPSLPETGSDEGYDFAEHQETADEIRQSEPDFGKSSGRQVANGNDDDWPLAGLVVPALVFVFCRDNADYQLLSVGHSDRGEPEELSAKRAQNALCVVLGDADGWIASCRDHHTPADWQRILLHFAVRYGWNCDQHEVSGKWDEPLRASLQCFRDGYEELRNRSAGTGDTLFPETAAAVFDLYQDELASLLEIEPEALGRQQSSLHLADAHQPFVGCGAAVGLDAIGDDGYRSRSPRRVELHLFKKGGAPPASAYPGVYRSYSFIRLEPEWWEAGAANFEQRPFSFEYKHCASKKPLHRGSDDHDQFEDWEVLSDDDREAKE